MRTSLRLRLILTTAPLLLLLGFLGASSLFLLSILGGSIDRILRENYDSVKLMHQFDEALDRMNAALHQSIEGRDKEAKAAFEERSKSAEVQLAGER